MTQEYYMVREVREGPSAFESTIEALPQIVEISREVATLYRCLLVCGSGTSYHAGVSLCYAASRLTGLESHPVPSSEFSEHAYHFLGRHHLLVAFSQSGESVDTLRAARLASEKGVDVLAVTGRRESMLGSLAKYLIEVRSGVERAIPATKSFMAQLAAAYSLALGIAAGVGRLDVAEEARRELARLPDALHRTLDLSERFAEELSGEIIAKKRVFILGYGPSYPAALEASLKLKEAGGVHAEAYSAREFRHGPLSLLGSEAALISIVPPEPGDTLQIFEQVCETARSTGAQVLIVSHGGAGPPPDLSLPPTLHELATAVEVVPFQLLAYYTAVKKSYNPDRPPLLSKVVR